MTPVKFNSDNKNNGCLLMETCYEISLNMKTGKGIERYGSFAIGTAENFARTLYSQMEGEEEVSPDSVITIELTKREHGIPYPLALRHCTYQQLASNVKLITKEVFKHFNLEH